MILILLLTSGICLSQTLPKAKTLTLSSSSDTNVKEPEIEQNSDATQGQKTLAKEPNSTYILTKHTPNRSVSAVTVYDFTTGSDKYYGGASGAKELETGVWGMISGDASGNGQIQNDDKNDYWMDELGTGGYVASDFNLNGQVQNDDKNDFWKINLGLGSAVP